MRFLAIKPVYYNILINIYSRSVQHINNGQSIWNLSRNE